MSETKQERSLTCHSDRSNLQQMAENYSDCHIAKGYCLGKNMSTDITSESIQFKNLSALI